LGDYIICLAATPARCDRGEARRRQLCFDLAPARFQVCLQRLFCIAGIYPLRVLAGLDFVFTFQPPRGALRQLA
jgi:hypothetical protein